MIRVDGTKTTCAFDNLLGAMRVAFYETVASGTTVDEVRSAVKPLCGYEQITSKGPEDTEPTTFKGIPVVVDASIPAREIQFRSRGECVAVVYNVS